MAKNGNISTSVIKRLPRYYRFLGELEKQGVERISSRELSERMKLTASQIRQDLNCFGGFGQQGYGYHVASLRDEIGHILGVDKEFPTILIGAGNLGKAIAMHINFGTRGCRLAGIFPITTTSANISDDEMLSRPSEILEQLDCEVDLVIDVGELKSEKASSIIDLTGLKPKIIRD